MSTNDIGLGPLGFSEEAQSITREVNRHMHGVTDRVRKGRAVLKMLKFWLNEHHSRQGVTEQELSDVEDLVDMALDELPHYYEGINDPVDEMIGQAGRAIKAGTDRDCAGSADGGDVAGCVGGRAESPGAAVGRGGGC